MKILDRYLTKNFLMPLVYCIILFCFIYVVVDIIGHLDEILKNKVPMQILYQYYLSFIPLIFVQTAPIAALVSMVYMLSTLSRHNELTAIKACGISLTRLLLPVFAAGVILSLSIFLVNENVVPKTVVRGEKIKAEYIDAESGQKPKDLKIINNIAVYGKKNQMIYAKLFNPTENELYNIIILENDASGRIYRKIMASNAVWNGSDWEFSNCSIYRFDKEGQPLGTPLIFSKKIIDMPESPKDLMKYERQLSYLNYKDLKDYIKRIASSDSKTKSSLYTDLYFKTALPFVCLVIMLLGIPFALVTVRGGAMAGIGISVGVGLIYYGSIYFFLALGKGGVLLPFVAAHLANILFFVLAILLIRRSPR